MKFSIIIPNSNVHETRQRNLEFVIGFYRDNFPDSQIIVSDQVVSDPALVPDFVDYLRVEDNSLFCKSVCFNSAIPYCKHDWIICADNDCILTDDALRYFKNSYFKNSFYGYFEFVMPYRYMLDLTERETVMLLNGQKVLGSRRAYKDDWVSNGGIVVVSKDGFKKVGGFDTQFIGWGCEDDVFVYKCSRLLRCGERSVYDLYHLSHHRLYKRAENPEFAKNRQERERIYSLSMDDLLSYVEEKKNEYAWLWDEFGE